jgi:nicotinate-nucleotide adenylyltransferase
MAKSASNATEPPRAIGLYGGTFDPPHNGHLALIRGALAAIDLAELRVFPAGDPYQKSARGISAAAHRIAMLELTCAGIDHVHIDARETTRQGATYTVDTLHELRTELGPHVPLIWLIGADAFARLESWHRAHELASLCHMAVVTRPGERSVPSTFAGFEPVDTDRIAPRAAGWSFHASIATPAVSSTHIRECVRRGDSIRALVPSRVCDYIEAHRLYRE